ncbi:MAG: protein kinase, partial [Pseudomonadota bacterium]
MTGYPRPYGHYVLLEPIGAGGMSEVDLAHRGMDDASFVRFVAIKRVARSNLADEGYVRMFMDEARINSELHHGNIVQVFDFGKQVDPALGREEYFMVMEYVPGLDLRALQRAAHARNELLPLRFSLAVLSEVLCGLQYAHTKADTIGRAMNLVHRDINPRNVMVSVTGEVKVIDFGVALAEDRLEKTQGRSLKGKFAYMSPEQIEGNVALDGRTDLYAVGLMLHELVEGKGPFHGLTELQIMHRIVMGQVPELQAVGSFPRPDLLRRVHARALARDRDRRYPDATTFKRDIDALADLLGGPATQDERAAPVHSLAPTEVDGIGSRLRLYHEHSHSVSRSVAVEGLSQLPEGSGSDLSLPRTADATASLGGETQELPKDLIEPPGGSLRRIGVAILALVGLALLFSMGAGVGLALWLRRGPGRLPGPAVTQPEPPPLGASIPPVDPPVPAEPEIRLPVPTLAEPRPPAPHVDRPAPAEAPVATAGGREPVALPPRVPVS